MDIILTTRENTHVSRFSATRSHETAVSADPPSYQMTGAEEPTGVRGWLLLLTRWLVVGQPILFALTASTAISALAIRGLPLALLMVARLLVTAFGLATGLAMTSRRPAAVTMAVASLVTSATVDVFTLATSIWPNNRMPGDTPIYLAGTLMFHAGWILYLLRSRRERATFGG